MYRRCKACSSALSFLDASANIDPEPKKRAYSALGYAINQTSDSTFGSVEMAPIIIALPRMLYAARASASPRELSSALDRSVHEGDAEPVSALFQVGTDVQEESRS